MAAHDEGLPMRSGDREITVSGERLWLLPERAVYWPRRQTLVVADIHFGKAAAFRSGAIPVPAGTTADNLQRLESALSRTAASRLVCLGDLLHARAGRVPATLEAVAAWREQHHQLEFLLVRGNHDVLAGDPPPSWRVSCVDEPFAAAPFVWRHFPESSADGYTIAGHHHPAVRLMGPAAMSETLPCFYFGTGYALLPAFGSFTGTALIHPAPGEQVFVLAGDEVIAVS